MNATANIGRVGVIWGLGGLIALLTYAVVRLSRFMWEIFSLDLSWYQWMLLGVNVVFMAYSEGYRGFQCAFSPRAAARARHLLHHPDRRRVLLAPLFCMGFFAARRRRLITTYTLTVAIVCLIIIIHYWVEQPWRGIIDAGVVVGLSWGILSLLVASWQAFTDSDYSISPELPGEEGEGGFQ